MKTIFLFSLTLSYVLCDQLLFVQTLWRHGDRIPTATYPNDPYQEDYWGMPWGELTTRGQKQQFLQGQRLKKLYIDGYNLVQSKYMRNETLIRSADTPRCIQSAIANLAGFYQGSPTHPTDVDGWPTDWTPIPVHSIPHDEDRELEPGTSCDKADQLTVDRALKKNFLDFVASNWQIIADILMHGGGTYESDFDTLEHIYGAISIEIDYYNLTQPDWITDQFYAGLKSAIEQGEDYIDGAAGFDYPEDTVLLKLRGGFLLNEWINNIQSAINGESLRYHAYSAHDSTVTALLLVLNAKQDIIGLKNPEYAATVSCEVWQKSDGYYVKFLYSADAYSEFVPITRFISGCPSNDDFCSVDDFIARSQKYIPTTQECNRF